MTHLASITVINSAGNEEYIEYFYNPDTKTYHTRITEDIFMTYELFTEELEISEETALKEIAMIKTCPDPDNKMCQCPVHRSGHRFGI